MHGEQSTVFPFSIYYQFSLCLDPMDPCILYILEKRKGCFWNQLKGRNGSRDLQCRRRRGGRKASCLARTSRHECMRKSTCASLAPRRADIRSPRPRSKPRCVMASLSLVQLAMRSQGVCFNLISYSVEKILKVYPGTEIEFCTDTYSQCQVYWWQNRETLIHIMCRLTVRIFYYLLQLAAKMPRWRSTDLGEALRLVFLEPNNETSHQYICTDYLINIDHMGEIR